MKSFTVEDGIATFKALPHPLPIQTQNLLKESAKHLERLREAAEKTLPKVHKAKAAEEYNAAFLDFEQQEEQLRTMIGVVVSRPVIRSIQVI